MMTVPAPRQAPDAFSVVRPYAETALMVTASTVMGLLVEPRFGTSPVDLLYLPTVLAAAGFYGLLPGLLAAVASALAYNFFFTHPVHTFRVANAADLVTVVLLFLVALVTSQLAARMRASARAAETSAARNATIAGLARKLLSCATEQQIGEVACHDLGDLFGANAVLLSGDGEPTLVAARPAHAAMTPSDLAMAAWSIESGQPAGRGEGSVTTTEWLFLPIRSGAAVLGVMGLARDDGTSPAPRDRRELLDNLIDQVALALERSRLESEARTANDLRARNRLRAGLLATIGQDIEPRLGAIGGGLNALSRSGTADKGLVAQIAAEVTKLRQYLASLLDVGDESERQPVTAGAVRIDLFKRLVTRDNEPVHLTPKEYAVLAELAKYQGRVLDHAHLLRAAWGPAQEKQHDYLRVAVRGLRTKLEPDPASPTLIINEPGVGYRLAAG